MRRFALFLSPGLVLGFTCLPADFVPNLVGSSISAVVGVLLSDTLNVLIPPL